MQSQGSTSSQPSFDSLSSSDSLLLSDSEQAEDDTDVFLTDGSSSVIIGSTGGSASGGDVGSESPGSQWMCDGFTDKEEDEESYRLENGSGSKPARIGLEETNHSSPKSEGDLLFAQKVETNSVMIQKMKKEAQYTDVDSSAQPELCCNLSSSLLLCQCAELQGFVRPLLELLNGLKRGRFDRGKCPDILDSSQARVESGNHISRF